ncbi:hypothetical protein BLOT_009869, partial [Blomia tropicalis]
MKKSNHMINCQIDFRTDKPERTFYKPGELPEFLLCTMITKWENPRKKSKFFQIFILITENELNFGGDNDLFATIHNEINYNFYNISWKTKYCYHKRKIQFNRIIFHRSIALRTIYLNSINFPYFFLNFGNFKISKPISDLSQHTFP